MPESHSHSRSADSCSDEALIARLYELAAQPARANGVVDQAELTLIDSIVYRRREQAYSRDPLDPAAPPGRLVS